MRLFIATPVQTSFSQHVLDYQPPEQAGVTLVRPDLLHMTLRFMGDTDPNQLDDVLRNIRFQPFETELTDTGLFSPKKGKHIMWLGVQLNSALSNLHRQISDSLKELDINPEDRDYTPHITVARCTRSTDPMTIQHFLNQTVSKATYQIDKFHLYLSHQRDGQLHYDPLKTYHSSPL